MITVNRSDQVENKILLVFYWILLALAPWGDL